MSNSIEFTTIDWREEATAVIEDIKNHVKNISISNQLNPNDREIFLNCETNELRKITIRLSADGYSVVGNEFDKIESNCIKVSTIYETPYGLLSAISPGYISSFGNQLTDKLNKLIDNE